jgi:4-alpha-glucanotransferase
MGAPPDAFSPLGQEWGTTPPNPFALREQAYASFIDLLRANMRGAGALRIDHILGFVRLFLVPAGSPPADGVYLRFPFEELAAIVKLESVRNSCLVIGEDLGTVPEGLSERLQSEGILSYRLFYFARDWSTGAFLRPDQHPREALVAIGTHDLPPLAGFWRGADIDERERLGLYPDEGAGERERWYRGEARARMAEALRAEGFAAEPGDEFPPAEAVHRFVARSAGRLMLVSFEDMLGLTESVNVPGTTSECPNWRRKLPASVAELLADERSARVVAALREERPARPVDG